jgi:hypothetical protein
MVISWKFAQGPASLLSLYLAAIWAIGWYSGLFSFCRSNAQVGGEKKTRKGKKKENKIKQSEKKKKQKREGRVRTAQID